jgi:hypothetical protein
MTRSKQQLVGHKRNRVRLQNQTEALLEEMRIKLLTTGEDLRPAWSVTLLSGRLFSAGEF